MGKKEGYKFEFHVHTKFSKDSILNKYFLLCASKIKKLDGLVLTDHNSIKACCYIDFFRRHHIDVIMGEEIMTCEGEIIGLFIEKEIQAMMTPETTVSEIKKQGGLVYIPHPYDKKRTKTVLSYSAQKRIVTDIDLIEVYNGRNSSEEDTKKQQRIVKELKEHNSNIVEVVGSDAHICWEIGNVYCITEEKINRNNLIYELRNGQLKKGKKKNFAHQWTKIVKGLKFISNLGTMQYKVMSMKEVDEEGKKLAIQVKKVFQPDLIVFIAKGGFLVGKAFAEVFQVPLVEITLERSGGKIKKNIAPIFRILPNQIRFWMIDLEMNMGIHQKLNERRVIVSDRLKLMADKKDNYKKILIVDDSIDTGETAFKAKETIKSIFPEADIRFASISVIRFSEERFHADYFLFKDSIIYTATSKDSEEYEKFLKVYNEWKKNGDSIFGC